MSQQHPGEIDFRALVESASDLIYQVRLVPEPHFEYVSPSSSRMVGYTPEQYYEDPELWEKLLHPDDLHHATDAITKERFGVPIVLRLQTPHRGTITTEQILHPLRDPSGALTGVVGIVRDIDERKKTEEELRRAQERLHMMVEASPMPMVEIDGKANILDMNSRFAELFGFTRDELPNVEAWWPLAYPDPVYREEVRSDWFRRMATARQSGLPVEPTVVTVTAKDGRRVNVEVNYVASDDRQFIMFYDLTEQVAMKERLAELNRDFTSFLDLTTDFVYFKDQESRIRFCSQTLADITHHASWRDMIGKHDLEIFPEETALIYHEEELPIFRDGQPLLGKIDPYFDAKGNKGWVNTNKWPVVDTKSGQVTGIFGISRDVTNLINTENELRSAKELAEASTRLKDQFVAIVAHDLRSPLSSMTGLLKVFATGEAAFNEEQRRQGLTEMLASAERMLTMIDELLDISRLQSGKVTIKPRFFKGRYLVASALSELDHAIRSKGLAVVNDIPVDMRIYADSTLFGEVLRNLLANAIKFCRPNDTITFSVSPDSPGTIIVKDTGVGVDPAILDDLFRHEVRTTRMGTAGEAGTGLGLPYCADIMKAHGGKLTATTAEGEGTTFIVHLPDVRPVVLVVDDELALRMTVRHYLGAIGVTVVEAEQGDEALRRIAESPPHLIIADVMMPVMDGFTLLERLKADPVGKEIPVVVLTSRNSDTRNQAFARGADDFLSKPVVADDLLSRVRKYLG